jgi:Mn2+/Fe2+ NRAMP family transporter
VTVSALFIYLYTKKDTNMFNPAMTSGVEIFVWIVVTLISFVAAISLVDFKKSTEK